MKTSAWAAALACASAVSIAHADTVTYIFSGKVTDLQSEAAEYFRYSTGQRYTLTLVVDSATQQSASSTRGTYGDPMYAPPGQPDGDAFVSSIDATLKIGAHRYAIEWGASPTGGQQQFSVLDGEQIFWQGGNTERVEGFQYVAEPAAGRSDINNYYAGIRYWAEYPAGDTSVIGPNGLVGGTELPTSWDVPGPLDRGDFFYFMDIGDPENPSGAAYFGASVTGLRVGAITRVGWQDVDGSSDWFDPGNYTNGQVPDTSSTVVFDQDEWRQIAFTGDAAVYGVEVQTGVLSLAIGDHTLSAEDGVVVGEGAVLMGSGTVQGDVVNEGTVAPGHSPGVLNVVGDFVNAGELNLEIASASDHDQLLVTGDFLWAGTVQVFFIDGYVPRAGDGFQLIDASQILHIGDNWAFGSPSLPSGLSWNFDSLWNSGYVSIVPEPGMLGLIGMASMLMRRRKCR